MRPGTAFPVTPWDNDINEWWFCCIQSPTPILLKALTQNNLLFWNVFYFFPSGWLRPNIKDWCSSSASFLMSLPSSLGHFPCLPLIITFFSKIYYQVYPTHTPTHILLCFPPPFPLCTISLLLVQTCCFDTIRMICAYPQSTGLQLRKNSSHVCMLGEILTCGS